MKHFLKTHGWEAPLYLIAAGLPLVTYFYIGPTGMEKLPWFPNQSSWTDFFLYGKSRCIHFLALLMAAVLIIQGVRKRNVRFGREWQLVLLFGGLELVSAFASQMPQQSFLGGIEQYEPVWVLLAYLVIGGYAYQYTMKNETPKALLYALFLGVVLSCMIGLTQLAQMDFWESEIGKKLLVPESFSELREGLRFTFSGDSWKSVYLALYNPNYAGIYLLMLLGLGAFLFRNTQQPYGKKHRIVIAAGIGVLVMILFGNVFSAEISSDEKLQEVVCEEEYVRITYQGQTIRLRDIPLEGEGVKYEILHEDGSRVALKWNENSGELEPYEEALQGLTFRVYKKDGISYAMFRYHEIPFRFTKDVGTGKYEYLSINGKLDDLEQAKALWNSHGSFLSGRGYLWSRTLPLLLEHPLLGSGPDSFLLVFPQDDYVARSNLGHSFFTQLLTNAHNLYLQTAVQTGIPALLCFLGFVFHYLKRSWKLYYGKRPDSDLERMGSGIFLGVAAYLICGLTFASSVCTTPFFWMLLGCGIAVNQKITLTVR